MNRMESRVEAGTTGGPDFSTFASPIDNFLNNYLPKDHETAIRQAIYNALALGVFLGLILGGYYVFVVLQPFVTPIFWAILTGFVIHPYKCSISDTVRATLAHFSASESTVLYVVVHSSCRRSVLLCDTIGGYVFSHLKVLAALLFLFPAFYFAFQLRPTLLYALFDWLAFFWRIPSHPVFQSFQFYHILGLWFLFMASLLFLSKELTTTSWSLRCFSLLTWLIMGCYLSSLLWTSVLHMIGFGVLAFACYRHQSSSSTDNVNSVNSSAPAEPFMSRLQAAILRGFSATFGGVIDGDFVEEESSKEGDSSSEQFLPEEEQLESRDIVQDIPKASALAEKKIPEDGDEGEAVRVTPVQPRSDVDGVMRVKSIIAVDKKMTASTPTAVKNKAPIPEPPNVDVIRHPGVAAIKQQHLQVRFQKASC